MRCLVAVAALCQLGAGLPSDYPSVPMNGISGKVQMPLFGVGTWQYNSTVAAGAVETAFKLGYRHVDTAFDYDNQVGVGQGLRASGLTREEYFVTSKIPGGLNASATTQALDQCLKDLALDHVDLMLIHWPSGMNPQSLPDGPAQRQESWLAVEKWAKAGKALAIGVSHYCERQFNDLKAVKTVPIAVNQVQYHVGMGSSGNFANDDKSFMDDNTLYQSFSPFCGPCTPPANKELITGEMVTRIGKAHGKLGSQVSLRWLVQQGIPVIPKSDSAAHLKENMDIFDFNLTAAEMTELTAATTPAVAGPSPTDSGDCGIKAQERIIV